MEEPRWRLNLSRRRGELPKLIKLYPKVWIWKASVRGLYEQIITQPFPWLYDLCTIVVRSVCEQGMSHTSLELYEACTRRIRQICDFFTFFTYFQMRVRWKCSWSVAVCFDVWPTSLATFNGSYLKFNNFSIASDMLPTAYKLYICAYMLYTHPYESAGNYKKVER